VERLAVALVVHQKDVLVPPVGLVGVLLALVQVDHRGGDAVVIAGPGQGSAHPVEDLALAPWDSLHAFAVAVREIAARVRVLAATKWRAAVHGAGLQQRHPLVVLAKRSVQSCQTRMSAPFIHSTA